MKGAAPGRRHKFQQRSEGSSPSPAQSSVMHRIARPGSSRTSESASSFHKDPWEQSVSRFILKQSREVLTARDWNGMDSLLLNRVLLAEPYMCPGIWAQNCTLEIGKRPNLDPENTARHLSRSWVRKSLVSLPWERAGFCVIEKSDC